MMKLLVWLKKQWKKENRWRICMQISFSCKLIPNWYIAFFGCVVNERIKLIAWNGDNFRVLEIPL